MEGAVWEKGRIKRHVRNQNLGKKGEEIRKGEKTLSTSLEEGRERENSSGLEIDCT